MNPAASSKPPASGAATPNFSITTPPPASCPSPRPDAHVPDLTLSTAQATPLPPAVKRPAGSRWSWAFLIDIAVFLFVCAAIFGVYAIGRSLLGPVHPHREISHDPRVLPLHALYSLVRINFAYALSLVFALA